MDLLLWIRDHPRDPKGEEWNWETLSRNKYISAEFMRRHPEIPWSADLLRQKSYRSAEDLPEMGHYAEIRYFLAHGQYTIKDLRKKLSSEQLTDFSIAIGGNPKVSIDELLEYPDIFIDPYIFHNRPDLTLRHVLMRPPTFWESPPFWDVLGAQPGISLAEMAAQPGYPWQPSHQLSNPGIDLEEKLAQPLTESEISFLSNNPSLTMEQIQAHPEIKFDFDQMAGNSKIPVDYYLSQGGCRSNLFQFSTHLTFLDVLTHSPDQWNYSRLVMYLPIPDYDAQLQVARMEQQNSSSYLSQLPSDMFRHYLHQYFF